MLRSCPAGPFVATGGDACEIIIQFIHIQVFLRGFVLCKTAELLLFFGEEQLFDQPKDSLLNSKVVPEDRAELHSLWSVLEIPFGPQQKTPTRLLKPERERERQRDPADGCSSNTSICVTNHVAGQVGRFTLYSLLVGLPDLIKQ